jgi:F0F1-type ATP synthase assembly protein I
LFIAEIDEIKEELNYLKVWLGIIVITTIGLIGWLINNYEVASNLKVIADVIAIIGLTISIIIIDKNIKNKIKSLKDL